MPGWRREGINPSPTKKRIEVLFSSFAGAPLYGLGAHPKGQITSYSCRPRIQIGFSTGSGAGFFFHK
jgi:hypothetical protein